MSIIWSSTNIKEIIKKLKETNAPVMVGMLIKNDVVYVEVKKGKFLQTIEYVSDDTIIASVHIEAYGPVIYVDNT